MGETGAYYPCILGRAVGRGGVEIGRKPPWRERFAFFFLTSFDLFFIHHEDSGIGELWWYDIRML